MRIIKTLGIALVAALATAAFASASALAASAPSVTTGKAIVGEAGLENTEAYVGGTVNPNGLATTYHFEYGRTTSYGLSSSTESAGSGTENVPVLAKITELWRPGTEYHYRLVASNADGTTYGADATLKTVGKAWTTAELKLTKGSTYPQSFSGKSSEIVELEGEYEIGCSEASLEGTLKSSQEASAHIVLHECKNHLVTCNSNGQAAGTIELSGSLIPVWLDSAHKHPAMLLVGEGAGSVLADLQCAYGILKPLSGSLVVPITSPERNVPSEQFGLKFEAEHNSPRYKLVEETGEAHELISNDKSPLGIESGRLPLKFTKAAVEAEFII